VKGDAVCEGYITGVMGLALSNNAVINSNLVVHGSATFSNTLSVASNASFLRDIVGSASLSLSSNALISANIVCGSNVSLSNNLFVGNSVVANSITCSNVLAHSKCDIGTVSTLDQLVLEVKGAIRSEDYLLTSDIRVKHNVSTLEPQFCEQCLERIPLIEYNLKYDATQRKRYGFIANEVQQVDPALVMELSDFLPNILQVATVKDNEIQIHCGKDPHICSGSVLKLISTVEPEKEVHAIITGVFPSYITIDTYALSGKTMFLYGTCVTDFKALDYTQLLALAIGNIKSLNEKVGQLQDTIDTIIAKLT
jgi:acetyltransferase-like isoleucine patch superfamily enzyme